MRSPPRKPRTGHSSASSRDPRLHGMYTGYPCSSHTLTYHPSAAPSGPSALATRALSADASPAARGRPSACEHASMRHEGQARPWDPPGRYECFPPLDEPPLRVCV